MKTLAVVLAGLVLLMGGCGLEEDAGDTFSVAFGGGSPFTNFEAPSSNSPYGFDPFIFGEYDWSLSGSELWLLRNYSPGTGTCCWEEGMAILLGGTPGQYSIGSGDMAAIYGHDLSGLYAGDFFTSGSIGGVTLTAMEPVGGAITGSYLFTLCFVPESTYIPDCSLGSLTLSGEFAMTREPDGIGGSGYGLRNGGGVESMRSLLGP